MNELVKIDHKEFGIQESKAKEIASQFKPMLEKMEELEKEFNEVMQMPIDDEKTAEKAKEVRLKYVKVRTGTANIHKEQKAFYLAGGRFVDGWKNAQAFASLGKEEKLKEIEESKERLEQQRLEKLQNERVEALSKYVEDAHERDLYSMDEDVWEAYIATKKQAYEDRIEAEKKAEAERLENERLDQVEQHRRYEIAPYLQFINESPELREMQEKVYQKLLRELKKAKAEYEAEQNRIRLENERLRKEAEAEKAKQAKIEAERKAKEEKERKAREAKEKAEREAYEAKLRKEREERERIEKELKEKAEAEAKAIEQARIEAERKAKAPIKEKLNLWVDEMQLPYIDAENEVTREIQLKFESFKSWAKSQVKNI